MGVPRFLCKKIENPYCLPKDKLPAFVEAVKGGEAAKKLLVELTEADTESILSCPSPLKKLSQLVLSGAAKIHALVDAAAESIERDGIACTSQLERTLFDDMNGPCRELMAALLSSEEATRVDYEPTGRERNGGRHEKSIVTLFGRLPRAHSFALSPDAIREIVGAHGEMAVAFARDKDAGEKEDKDAPADIVYGFADGDPFRLSDTTTYVATMDRRAKFEKRARAEFDRRFGRKPTLMIYIGDGGRWVHSVHDNEFPFAVEILDIFHAIEHLKPLMLGLGLKEGSKRWKRLHKCLRDRIAAGKIESVLKSIRKGKYGRLTKAAMKEYKYFRRNKDRMKYDEYRANGWFYGSGMVESGCKTVVGQRFKQSGMIWSLDGAKALLALRTLYKLNRLDEFFNHLVAGLPQVACAA